jgi:predicted MFS family arabinose efflux permease
MGLVAKIIPPERLSSSWAIRFTIQGLIGICAGGIIAFVLDRFPGNQGYGILFLIAFGFLVMSYLMFTFIRETNEPEQDQEKKHISLRENLSQIPSLIKTDKQLMNYLLTRSIVNGMFILIPFLAIHARQVTCKPQSFLGLLVTFQLGGGIIGNVFAGWLGDRYGGKVLLLINRFLFLGVCFWAGIAQAVWEFYAVFALLGISYFTNQVGSSTLSIELSSGPKRPTYLAMMSFANVPGMLAATFISSFLWSWTGHIQAAAALTAVCTLWSLIYLLRIKEPRQKKDAKPAVPQ